MSGTWLHTGVVRIDNDEELWLDIHHRAHAPAMEVVETFIEAAWEHGLSRVTVVHGAADVTSLAAAMWRGRGSVKWAIRRALNDGEYMEWAYYSGSKKHSKDVHAGRITIALRPNPRSKSNVDWPHLPPLDY